jgi:DNA-binding FrmR family transcriptional regulator
MKSEQRAIDKSRRTIEREKEKLDRQRMKNLEAFKKMAQSGNQAGAKMMAKDIVRMQNQSKNLEKISGQMNGMKMKVQNANSLNTINKALESSANAMNLANRNMNIGNLQNNAKNIMKLNDKLEMKSDMISDALDNLYDDDEYESNQLYQQVLREAGYQINEELPGSVKQPIYQQQNKIDLKNFKSGDNELDDLLNQL